MASLRDLETILSYKTLGPVYSRYQQDVLNPFYDYYTSGPSGQYDTDEVTFLDIGDDRAAAPFNNRDQPARVLQPGGIGEAAVTMVRLFNKIRLKGDSLRALRSRTEHSLQRKAEQEVAMQAERFARKQAIAKRLYVMKQFQGTTIYFREDGQILEGATGAAYSVATGVPTINLGTIDKTEQGIGTGTVNSTLWTDPSAKILNQLDDLNEATEAASNPRLTDVWLHTTMRRHIVANTQIQEEWGKDRGGLDRASRAAEGIEIGDYRFRFFGGTYDAADGTRTPYINRTLAIVAPVPTEDDYIVRGDGLELVPGSLDVKASALEALGDLDETYGPFAYTKLDHDPPGVDMYAGDNFLWAFRNPSAVFAITVSN
ncbi:MAG: major capsid protein [Planctomycetota bacterium]